MSIEDISDVTGLTIDEVKKLKENKHINIDILN